MVIVRTPPAEAAELALLVPSFTAHVVAASAAKISVPVVVMTILSPDRSAVSSVCVNTILAGVDPAAYVAGTIEVATTPV
jgi:hypothetical protein